MNAHTAMANTSPSQTCDSHNKTPVAIVLFDPNALLHSYPGNTIPYLEHLLCRLGETTSPGKQMHIGYVKYVPVHCTDSHLSVTPIVPVCAPMKVPSSQPIAGCSSGLTALDGYVVAMKMFDHFAQTQREKGQDPEEEFSYHLWHITAGEHGCVEHEYSAYLYWGWKWNSVASELKRCNVKLSMILLSPCPKFSALFSAVSPEGTKPWFRTCPHHDFLLSGFDAHGPTSDSVSPTIPAKRPADTIAENCPQRPRMEDFSQARTKPTLAPTNSPTIPFHPPMVYRDPIVPQATVDLTIQTPAHEARSMKDDKPMWLGNLIWYRGGSEVDTKIQAIHPIRDSEPRISKLPAVLRAEIVKTGMGTLNMQVLIRRLKAPVMRFQCPPGIDNKHFGEFIETLREGKSVAVVQEIQDQGSPKTGLVLVPLHNCLLCATFPVSELPKADLQMSQETQLQADHIPQANISYDDPEYSQGEDPNSPESDTSVTVETPIQLMSPQQFQSQQQQVYDQGELQQLQGQQQEHHAFMDAQLSLAEALTGCGSEPIVTTENDTSVQAVFGPNLPHIGQWNVGSNMYVASMDGTGMDMMNSQACGVTQNAGDIMFQAMIQFPQCS